MKNLPYILILSLLCHTTVFAGDALDPDFDTWPLAANNWLQVNDFEHTHVITSSILYDYINLTYVATHQTFYDAKGDFTVYDRAAYIYGRRTPIDTSFIQLDNFGNKQLMMTGSGYYFIHLGKDKSTPHRFIVQMYDGVFNIYSRDVDTKLSKKILAQLKQYLVPKNIYKNSIIEFKSSRVGFMQNTASFNYKWDDLILDADLKRNSIENTHDYLLNFPIYKAMNIKPKKGVLLQGPPGTGKSFLGQILISNVLKGKLKKKSSFVYLSARHLSNSYMIKKLFKVSKELSPTTIFMEDLDLVGVRSRSGEKKAVYDQVVLNEFLNGLDGLVESDGVLTIATTNNADSLDPALIRSGRLGLHITYGLPKFTIRSKFFERFGKKGAVWEKGISVEWLSSESEGFSGADIIEAIDLAKQFAYEDDSKNADESKLLLTKFYFSEAFRIIAENQGRKSFTLALSNLFN
ncbi:MAG: AAA family ATPase [Bacteriovoracaceae bacterium]|jgi:ATP-dependent 26S proteasome regulatory subunit|nr:AAA family ATPase [Bacteriovoracaceae bacterium]